MALSKEALAKYGEMHALDGIEAMIDDMVDTPTIMKLVRAYAAGRYHTGRQAGIREQESRSHNRPGDGDMGG
jgi:hypothetical protein